MGRVFVQGGEGKVGESLGGVSAWMKTQGGRQVTHIIGGLERCALDERGNPVSAQELVAGAWR